MSDEDNTGGTPEEQEAQQRAEAARVEAEEKVKREQQAAEDEKKYPASYVKKITNENAARRKHEEELEAELKKFRDKELESESDLKKKIEGYQKRERDSEAQFKDKLTASDRRFILSEAKRLAKDAGIIDVDDVKAALDLGDLRIGDDDEVVGLEEKISALRAAKPHWFKSADAEKNKNKDGHRVVTPPRKEGANGGRDWKTASDEEVSAQLKALGVVA